MTSRKRNKGKERKAKKAELEAEKVALEVERVRMDRERGIVRNKWKSWALGTWGGCQWAVYSVQSL